MQSKDNTQEINEIIEKVESFNDKDFVCQYHKDKKLFSIYSQSTKQSVLLEIDKMEYFINFAKKYENAKSNNPSENMDEIESALAKYIHNQK